MTGPSTKEERLASIEQSIKNIEGFMKEIKASVVWKETCMERHKGVDARITTVKRKACRNEKRIEAHKKDVEEDTKYTVTTIIAIIALIIAAGASLITYVGG